MPNNHGRKWIRDDKRLAIYLRDGLACVWCNLGIESGIALTLDHFKARSKKGDNSARNLVTSCVSCNSRRGNLPAHQYAIVAAYDQSRDDSDAILKRVHRQRAMSLPYFRKQAQELLRSRGLTQVVASIRHERKGAA